MSFSVLGSHPGYYVTFSSLVLFSSLGYKSFLDFPVFDDLLISEEILIMYIVGHHSI